MFIHQNLCTPQLVLHHRAVRARARVYILPNQTQHPIIMDMFFFFLSFPFSVSFTFILWSLEAGKEFPEVGRRNKASDLKG